MTGTSGEQAESAPGTVTPTGFNQSHMDLIVGFVAHLATNRSHHSSSSDNTDMDSSRPTAYDALQTTAIQFALDSVIDASDGCLAPTISNILRYFCTGKSLWYLILELVGLPNNTVRNRALQMLRLSFTSPNKKLDTKQVLAFERVNGFLYIADCLAGSI
jgi:hypothetical protein